MARRRYPSTDSHRFFDWLSFAERDLTAARRLSGEPRCYALCAFHLQQCIEKALKAFILISSGNLVDGHNLTWLCRRACNEDREFGRWLDDSASLNRYYIETRYPSDRGIWVGKKELERLFAITEEMYQFILDQVEDEREDSSGGESRG